MLCATWDSSADRAEKAFTSALFHQRKPWTGEGGKETGVPWAPWWWASVHATYQCSKIPAPSKTWTHSLALVAVACKESILANHCTTLCRLKPNTRTHARTQAHAPSPPPPPPLHIHTHTSTTMTTYRPSGRLCFNQNTVKKEKKGFCVILHCCRLKSIDEIPFSLYFPVPKHVYFSTLPAK